MGQKGTIGEMGVVIEGLRNLLKMRRRWKAVVGLSPIVGLGLVVDLVVGLTKMGHNQIGLW
jgi:hypothetical protein